MILNLEETCENDGVDRSSNWKTWLILALVYGLYFATTFFHNDLPGLPVFILGGITLAWFESVQHELIHDHPSRYT